MSMHEQITQIRYVAHPGWARTADYDAEGPYAEIIGIKLDDREVNLDGRDPKTKALIEKAQEMAGEAEAWKEEERP